MIEALITQAIDCIPDEERCQHCPMNILTADRRNACLEVKAAAEALRRAERLTHKPLESIGVTAKRRMPILDDERN